MITIQIVLLILLGLVALIDLRFMKVPSFFLTAIIFITAIVHFADFEVGMISLSFGVLAFIFAWALYELNYIGGIADVKVMVIIGLMITSIQMFFVFMLLVVLFGMVYQLVFYFVLKKKEGEEIPFLLPLYAVYIVLLIIGGVM